MIKITLGDKSFSLDKKTAIKDLIPIEKQKEYFELTNSYHLIVLDNEKEFVFNKTIAFLKNRLLETNEVLQV